MFWKATRKQSVVKLTIITVSYISLMSHILKENYFVSESDSTSKFSIYYNILKSYEEAINCEVYDYN